MTTAGNSELNWAGRKSLHTTFENMDIRENRGLKRSRVLQGVHPPPILFLIRHAIFVSALDGLLVHLSRLISFVASLLEVRKCAPSYFVVCPQGCRGLATPRINADPPTNNGTPLSPLVPSTPHRMCGIFQLLYFMHYPDHMPGKQP